MGGTGTVIASVLGLGVAGAAAALLVASRPRTIDGAELLAAGFDVGPLPFDLRVASAARLPTGERTVVLEPANVEPEAPLLPAPEAPKPDEPKPPFDWSKVPIGESGKPPREVILVWFPGATAEAQLKRLFDPQDWRDLRGLGPMGGLTEIETAKIDWGGYDAPLVHLRHYEPGGTFRDTIRVNLSAAGERCALHAIWPRGLPASKERVKELLKALAPRVKPAPRPG